MQWVKHKSRLWRDGDGESGHGAWQIRYFFVTAAKMNSNTANIHSGQKKKPARTKNTPIIEAHPMGLL